MYTRALFGWDVDDLCGDDLFRWDEYDAGDDGNVDRTCEFNFCDDTQSYRKWTALLEFDDQRIV